ncbi:hypothetical protein LIA77_05424 [Sarocladium implicatum]|nr:hypothetical protein LIA77_05424 [Sarocladium implicatum]
MHFTSTALLLPIFSRLGGGAPQKALKHQCLSPSLQPASTHTCIGPSHASDAAPVFVLNRSDTTGVIQPSSSTGLQAANSPTRLPTVPEIYLVNPLFIDSHCGHCSLVRPSTPRTISVGHKSNANEYGLIGGRSPKCRTRSRCREEPSVNPPLLGTPRKVGTRHEPSPDMGLIASAKTGLLQLDVIPRYQTLLCLPYTQYTGSCATWSSETVCDEMD